MVKDVGKIVGRYFQVMGVVSLLTIAIQFLLSHSLRVDFTFLLMFWAGHHLVRHNPTARNWTIGVCGFVMIVLLGLYGYVLYHGTGQMSVQFFWKHYENPSLRTFTVVTVFIEVLLGFPVAMLLTPQARREFRSNDQSSE